MLRVAAGRAGGTAWRYRYPCSRCCMLTTAAADAESLLSSSSSSSSDENILTSNKGHKRTRSNRVNINNRQQHAQHQTQARRRHRAKQGGGSARRSAAQAGDALAVAAAAERALPDKAALLLPRATERMEAFLRCRALLPPPPAAWLRPVDEDDSLSGGGGDAEDTNDEEAHNDDVLAQRIALHNDVVQLLLILRDSILGGHVSPRGGRNGLVLSDLLGNILLLLGESPPLHIMTGQQGNAQTNKRTTSPADAAAIGLDLLRRTNLDVRPDHYASAVRAACHDGRWEMASDLFASQCNPNSAGLVPVDSTLGSDSTAELGLYAIARQSRDEQGGDGGGPSASADKVFDAALGMSIISPTDQDSYVLAAGSALGRAGEWEACVEFAKRSDDAERLGQPLVAAAMLACVECSQYDTALNVYTESMSNPSLGGSEWQWGGGFDIVHPVSRDLALRSMGRSSKGGWGAQAMDIFRNQIIAERAAISSDALLGLIMTLERDGEWQLAFEILNTLLRKSGSSGSFTRRRAEWTIVPQTIDVQARDHSSTDAIADVGISNSMLSSIMNACNSCGEFGLALLCERMVAIQRGQIASVMDATNNSQYAIATTLVASRQSDALQSERLLLSQMSSLCGLKCYDDAVALFDEISQAAADKEWRQAKVCAEFASAEAASLDSAAFVKSQAWKSAFRHMNRICVAARILGEEKGEHLSKEEALILADALGHCMSFCNDAGQPRAGLALAERVIGFLDSSNRGGRSLGSSIMSFLGIGEGSGKSKPNSVLGSDKFEGSDLLLSSTMRCYHLLDRSADAIDLFFDTVDRISMAEKEHEHSDFVHSWNEAIALLFHEGRSEEAMNLYDVLEDHLKTPETFIVAAKGLASQQNWRGTSQVYTRALKEHCLSEDLALLAMKAVVEQELDGKIGTLRSISDEVAAMEGHSSKDWIQTRYWTLKRELGWRFARLLMWWNDPNTASEEELLLAVEQLEAAKNDEIIPKNDDLRCIVRYASFKINREGENSFGSLQSSQLIELVLEAILEAQRTSLWTQPSFITSSAISLRALSANKECVQLVRDALSQGIRVSKRALKEALGAAQDIGDSVAVEELSAALKDLKI